MSRKKFMSLGYVALFVFGMAVGSFLNVFVLRYDPSAGVFNLKNLSGRSRCIYCGKVLKWFELIPILSFLLQGGKCLACGRRLLLQYPAVEAITGVLFVAVPLFLNNFYAISGDRFVSFAAPFSHYILILAWLMVFLLWLAAALIDFRHYIIPNELNVSLVILGIAISLILSAEDGAAPLFKNSFLKHYALLFSFSNFGVFLNHLVGSLAGALFFGALAVLSRGRAMGMGDVKLAFASGLILGWPDIGLVIALSFIFGGVWGLALVFSKRKKMKDKVPFAPFFLLGALATFFFGYDIMVLYFKLFNL